MSCDHDRYRRRVRAKGVRPVIARRGTEHGSGPGARRWVTEQTIALPQGFRRLRIRWEIRDDIHEALLRLGRTLIRRRRLRTALREKLTSAMATAARTSRPGVSARPADRCARTGRPLPVQIPWWDSASGSARADCRGRCPEGRLP